MDAIDYLKAETKTETVFGVVDNKAVVICYPHKPSVTSVTSFAFRKTPMDDLQAVDPSRMFLSGGRIEAFPTTTTVISCRVQITLTYVGGLAAAVADLPADIQEAATITAIRYYREAESGLSDSIGLAEFSTMIYTKAWPIRVLDMLQPYIRTVGWRNVA